jgi:hypothetical protein
MIRMIETCTKCHRRRPDTIADATCREGGYCDWKEPAFAPGDMCLCEDAFCVHSAGSSDRPCTACGCKHFMIRGYLSHMALHDEVSEAGQVGPFGPCVTCGSKADIALVHELRGREPYCFCRAHFNALVQAFEKTLRSMGARRQ